MPTLDYTCPACKHTFKRVVLRGDEDRKTPCPNCRHKIVVPSETSASLFNGIANFSELSKDTN